MMEIDRFDRQILQILQVDGRISNQDLADRIGTPSLVVCLDSFCGDYDRMWVTTSLRGLLRTPV